MSRILISLTLALAVFSGCGKHDESSAKRAGGKVGETLTEFASGVGKGIDKQLLVNVELSENLTNQGITKTVSKAIGLDQPDKKGITVYFIAQTPFNGTLIAKAMNKEGMETGRSVVDVEFSADDAKYVTFYFDPQMDAQLVDKYVVDIKK